MNKYYVLGIIGALLASLNNSVPLLLLTIGIVCLLMIQDKEFHNGMFVQPGVEYQSKNHGKWWFLGSELFWNKCSDEVEKKSINGAY